MKSKRGTCVSETGEEEQEEQEEQRRSEETSRRDGGGRTQILAEIESLMHLGMELEVVAWCSMEMGCMVHQCGSYIVYYLLCLRAACSVPLLTSYFFIIIFALPSKYALSILHRLHLQHYVIRHAFGGNTRAKFDGKIHKDVLDVGCGPGTWILGKFMFSRLSLIASFTLPMTLHTYLPTYLPTFTIPHQMYRPFLLSISLFRSLLSTVFSQLFVFVFCLLYCLLLFCALCVVLVVCSSTSVF